MGAAADSKASTRGRWHRRVGTEYAAGAQLVQVGEADSGKGIEEVGLDGANAVRVLGAGAKGAADCHAIIVGGASSASIPACAPGT